MRTVDLIYKKRQGDKLSRPEIEFLIEGYTAGEIPDYQMSAWAMAVFFQGMDREETAWLTGAMVDSGDRIDLGAIPGVKVDKHSTGGVGDTTSLILVPLIAAAGVPVAKMSGRGLGHTGGTIDKLESIPGFNTELSREQFLKTVRDTGAAIVSQSGNLTPADKKLYALRDVTATVESIPLIASSIMSKKIAGGADKIVLDVKVGRGAFMKELDRARKLGETMVEIGREIGRETIAVITAMEEPLGRAVGNALEVREAVEVLKGEGPSDLRELCLTLGSNMLLLAGKAENFVQGQEKLEELITSGQALAKFKAMIEAQGGKKEIVAEPDLLPAVEKVVEIKSVRSGFINEIDAEEIGRVAMQLGAGRETKDQDIDMAAGIIINKKYGDEVKAKEPLAFIHTRAGFILSSIEEQIRNAFSFTEKIPEKKKLIYDIIK